VKILLSSESYWPNKDGGAVFEHRLVHELIEGGHQVNVVVPGNSAHSYEEQDEASTIYRSASMKLPFTNGAYRVTSWPLQAVRCALKAQRPDVIHVHTLGPLGLVLLWRARRDHIPIVATNHLMPENVLMSLPSFLKDNKYVHMLFWRVIVGFHNRFDEVTSPTPSAVQLLKEHGLKRPVRAISNGIDTSLYVPKKTEKTVSDSRIARFSIKKSYIIYLGRVSAEKRIDQLIDGFALFAKNNDKADLVIAGKGSRLEQLKEYAREQGLTERVTFTGLVSDEEKIALLQNAELYAITSPAELQSIATLEAMACGLPVVAVDIAALHELCRDGTNGFLVPAGDAGALAEALEKIVSDSKRRKKFGEASRTIAVSKHSNKNTYQEYESLYKRVCRKES
jgi:glycosyltransferase involved in cell wall biosynthesis